MINLSEYRKIHCIGIGGIGLSAVAEIFMSRGYEVSGSDMRESDITEKLLEQGAKIFLGHRAKNVEDVDLVVYTVAVGDDNPELARARELGIPAITRAQALGALMGEYNNSIAISGTHGKTTTTSMVSLILKNAKKEPTILVGGNLDEIGGNCYVGGKDYFVTEACEYQDSFLELRPNIEIILNIDSDHLDYFKNVEHIARSFEKFAKLVPKDGVVIAYDSNVYVRYATEGLPNVVTFGIAQGCDYSASNIHFDTDGMPRFNVIHEGRELCTMKLSVPGEHNILNALAAFACTHIMGVEVEDIVKTLEQYHGTHRRFDILGRTSTGVKIIDDYAHHPTEIKATLAAIRNMKHNTLWCLFQPHTYTRTVALIDEFGEAFDNADEIVLAEIYAAREKNIYKISSKIMMDKILEHNPSKHVFFIEDFEDIASFVYDRAEPGDLVLTMGAGDIYKVGEMILDMDAARIETIGKTKEREREYKRIED
ncbi:MAG: UDP-N-acetylmuramate--L-alanine ligase [Firmicutes bacterium]|nr:UDP-N-acetylmuramate--L-alanine ligase [Bacillota bacterium]